MDCDEEAVPFEETPCEALLPEMETLLWYNTATNESIDLYNVSEAIFNDEYDYVPYMRKADKTAFYQRHTPLPTVYEEDDDVEVLL